MSKKLVLSIEENGSIYRGSKLIGKVVDDDIKFKHHAYRKHLEEIRLLMADEDPEGSYDDEPVADIGLEPLVDVKPDPVTPAHLFLVGEGKWYGEENPPVVEWRRENWSKEAFDDKYAHKEMLLQEIYDKHDMIYDRNNSND